MSRPISNENQIQAFMHCSLCMKEHCRPNIEAGWTPQGFQVWCLTHNVNVIHMDFEGAKHPANTTRNRIPGEVPNEDPLVKPN